MTPPTPVRSLRRRALGAAGILALTASGLAATTAPALAAEQDLTDATFTWSINDESGGGAFFGGCNFLSAGAAGSTGSSRLWTEADGFYSVQDGNVRVEKPAAGGGFEAPSWSTKCRNADGNAVNTQPGSTTGNRFVFSAGSGAVDLAAGTAEIDWDGSATIVFYGGMTYWTISDPQLSIADGQGQITATATGFGADMYDPSLWVPLDPTDIVIADLSEVDLTADGFTATPDYLGVEVEVEPGGPSGEQVRTGPHWGGFPQSLVDFNVQTGQAAYWYSSGGTVDAKKPTNPLTIGWSLDDDGGDPDPDPGDGEPIDIEVTIPEGDDPDPGPGAFSWVINGSGAVSLNQAAATEAGFTASGELHPVVVTDTRADSPGWEINGRAGQFLANPGSHTFGGNALGWTPAIDSAPQGVEAGPQVTPGSAGLGQSSLLARSNPGVTSGEVTVNAGLDLLAPADTPAGAYRSTLTLTALS